MRGSSLLPFAGVALVAALLAGCPDDEPGASSSGTSGSSGSSGSSRCRDYVPPASFDALSPAVHFAADVLPIFAQSCAFSTCHGSTSGSSNGVFLGRDAAKVHASIVNVKGEELPTMAFVTPGDPGNSYLMRKMDGSHCTFDAQCANGTCLSLMPKGETEPLPVERRDVLRRWIAQGAKND